MAVFFAFELYTVKDFVCYCLISTGSEVTKYESFSVMKTLKADGLPLMSGQEYYKLA